MTGRSPPEHVGCVDLLNIDAGFGYVVTAGRERRYIFVAGKACPWRVFGALRLEQQVAFRLAAGERVVKLRPTSPLVSETRFA